MAVYLGDAGAVRFTRFSDESFKSTLDAGDVNIGEKRFSFDFHHGTFQTGDRLMFQRLNADGTPSSQLLDFVDPSGWFDGLSHPDGAWYANVDPLGGIRLYRSWADALNGSLINAIPLAIPSASYLISVTEASIAAHYLGQVTGFAVNLSREAIDVASLGDAFAQYASGLIGMSGDVDCFWDWRSSDCGDDSDLERAQYLHELILRQQIGAEFDAEFILKDFGRVSLDGESSAKDQARVAIKGVCLLTQAGLEFSPDQPLVSKFSFVSKGDLSLTFKQGNGFNLLTEDGDYLDMQDGTRFEEEQG